MNKIYIDFGNKIYQFKATKAKGWSTRSISDADLKLLRDGAIEIDFSAASGDLVFDRSRQEAEAKERDKEAAIIQEKEMAIAFNYAVLDFFVKISFELDDADLNFLFRVEKYVERTGGFPPLSMIAEKKPSLLARLAAEIEAGKLPEMPENLALEYAEVQKTLSS